jgi:hypothetical protein
LFPRWRHRAPAPLWFATSRWCSSTSPPTGQGFSLLQRTEGRSTFSRCGPEARCLLGPARRRARCGTPTFCGAATRLPTSAPFRGRTMVDTSLLGRGAAPFVS